MTFLFAHAPAQHFGEDVVNQSLKIAEPITSRFNGQLSFLDVQAVKALEFAESKWSYPFKATPQQVAGLPRSVINAYADALQKAWDARVQPQVNNASAKFEELKGQNAFVQRTADAVAQLQVNLAKTVEHLKANRPNGDKAAGEAQGIINNISGEFEKLRQFAAGVPADARKRIDPVIESFGNTYHHLNKEVREGSGPILPRLQKVLTYVQEEALPALRKAAFQPIESGGAAPKVNGSGSGGNSSSSANAK